MDKCQFCNSVNELCLSDYSIILNIKKNNELNIVDQLIRKSKKINICKKCYLEKHPECFCKKCNSFLITYKNQKPIDFCNCWKEIIENHKGKWKQIEDDEKITFFCEEITKNIFYIMFYNSFRKIIIRCHYIEPENYFIKVFKKKYKCNWLIVPTGKLLKKKLINDIEMDNIIQNSNFIISNEKDLMNYYVEKSGNECWMQIEDTKHDKFLCYYSGILPKYPIRKDTKEIIDTLDDIKIILDNVLELEINEEKFHYVFNESDIFKYGLKKCNYFFKISKNSKIDDLDIKILKFYHDTKCCTKFGKYIYDEI